MKYRALLLTVASGVFHSNFISTSAEAQAGNTPTAVKGNENAAKGWYSQILDGPNLTRKAVPFRFTGKGAIPINFVLDQSSGEKKPLKSKAMVIVYKARGSNRRSIGEIVTIWKSPVMTTEANVEKKIPVDTKIPLQPGDYVIDVVVCDTDEPISQSKLMEYHPEPEKFPGMMINLRQYLVTVE
jgi:hypothetical protein